MDYVGADCIATNCLQQYQPAFERFIRYSGAERPGIVVETI
ncbi:MAG TPA: hypothetical protein VMH30_05010 [Verrucomicrobiae bacterium]|nr:hypothetical protein [Verrucomicrobiae bacterium]